MLSLDGALAFYILQSYTVRDEDIYASVDPVGCIHGLLRLVKKNVLSFIYFEIFSVISQSSLCSLFQIYRKSRL